MQPARVTVTGSFANHDRPVQGLVRFTPGRLWVVASNITWACLAPEVWLDPDGSFVAQVTPTDTDAIMWTYKVCTPAGCWLVYIPTNDAGWSLRELIYEHRPGPRSAH